MREPMTDQEREALATWMCDLIKGFDFDLFGFPDQDDEADQ
jgi:hypothetical protein